MGWIEYALAFAAFFLTHSLPVRPPLRPWLQARLGQAGFTLSYSALSLAVLSWLLSASGRAPYVHLWDWAPWQNTAVLAVMLPVCLVLALAIGRPNPFSFGGARNAEYNPDRPGIVRLTRHPLLFALGLWAAAHILPNGDLVHVILFGTFTTFAVAGGWLIDRRKRRASPSVWNGLETRRRAASFFPAPGSWANAAFRCFLGAGLYASIIWLHPSLFGVDPLQ